MPFTRAATNAPAFKLPWMTASGKFQSENFSEDRKNYHLNYPAEQRLILWFLDSPHAGLLLSITEISFFSPDSQAFLFRFPDLYVYPSP